MLALGRRSDGGTLLETHFAISTQFFTFFAWILVHFDQSQEKERKTIHSTISPKTRSGGEVDQATLQDLVKSQLMQLALDG